MKRFYDVEFKLIFFDGIKKKKYDPNKKIINEDKNSFKNLVPFYTINMSVEVDVPKDRTKKEVVKAVKEEVVRSYVYPRRRKDWINKMLAEQHKNFYGFAFFKIKEVQSEFIRVHINSVQETVEGIQDAN